MNYRKKIKNVSKKDCRESGGLFVMRKFLDLRSKEFSFFACWLKTGEKF